MTNVTELRRRFEDLADRANRDEDVADALYALAYELEEASEAASDQEDAQDLLERASDARRYADRLDRWAENSRRRKRRDEEETA